MKPLQSFTFHLMYMLVLVSHCVSTYSKSNENSVNEESHHRAKRWINFPAGSSLQLVYCWLISTYGTADGIFVVGITVGLAWEIPVDLRSAYFERGRSLHDLHRRELHRKIEKFIDQQGHSGSSCVKKAICHAHKIPSHNNLRFVQALLHAIFKLDSVENEELESCETSHQCPLDFFHPNRVFAM